jgi:mannose-6-phosphate isomerase
MLYPLLFTPTPVERTWGGNYLAKTLHPQFPAEKKIGESWELCGLEGNNSIVRNGFLEGNEINELIEIYMGDLIGDALYQKFGCEFPLLVKILDINDYLSFQVHPPDEIALSRHNAYGKAEAWYILHAEPDAAIFLGFNRLMNRDELQSRCLNQTLPEVMNQYTPRTGDCFYIPPGTVHSAGGGLILIEIQQVSDITYRIYDWGREFQKESARDMHLALAMDVIHWESCLHPELTPMEHGVRQLVKSPYFDLSKRVITESTTLTNTFGSSFRLIICTEGEIQVTANQTVHLKRGEITLIPAAIGEYKVIPVMGPAHLLESSIS